MSPTLNPVDDVSTTVVSPTDVEASFKVVFAVSSYAVAEGHIETSKLFPQAPAVLAAHSPTDPCPVAKLFV